VNDGAIDAGQGRTGLARRVIEVGRASLIVDELKQPLRQRAPANREYPPL